MYDVVLITAYKPDPFGTAILKIVFLKIMFFKSVLFKIARSPRGSSIGREPRLMKRRSQDRIPPPLTLVWTCQKKKKSHGRLVKHVKKFFFIQLNV
jgi:hypothetical protein